MTNPRPDTAPRCPICTARGRHVRADGRECDHCGLLMRPGVPLDGIRGEVRRWLAGAAAPGGWRLDGHAVRDAAWSLGLVRGGAGWRPAAAVPHDVTLAVMARAAEAGAVAAMVADLGFRRAVVLLDGAADVAGFGSGTHVATHPLAGDYAAQRNRMQAMAAARGGGWVLHLDSDERATPALRAALGWLTRAADADGLAALGLPRRNRVDGRLSDLHPDIQYRLVRAEVGFAGRVHERPAVPFDRTALALAGAIEHRLSRARVIERTRHYGAMAADGARPQDEAALLRPYRGPPHAAA